MKHTFDRPYLTQSIKTTADGLQTLFGKFHHYLKISVRVRLRWPKKNLLIPGEYVSWRPGASRLVPFESKHLKPIASFLVWQACTSFFLNLQTKMRPALACNWALHCLSHFTHIANATGCAMPAIGPVDDPASVSLLCGDDADPDFQEFINELGG